MIKKCWSYDPNERPTFLEIYDKLSLSDNVFYTDLHGNLCEPAIDDYDEEYDDDDHVKFDILNKYIREINKYDEKSLKTRDESQLLVILVIKLKFGVPKEEMKATPTLAVIENIPQAYLIVKQK